MTDQGFKVRRMADLGIEVVEAYSSRSFGRHMHDHFGIGLVLAGAQRSASGRGEVEASAGDLISVNPAEVHDGMPIGAGARRWHMLYFDPQLIAASLADMAAETGLSAQEFAYPVLRKPQAVARFRSLYQAVTEAGASGDRLDIDEALPLLLMQLLGRPVPRAPMQYSGVTRAKALIDDEPQALVSLADLATEAGMSRFQLVRAFARLTGLTPHAYRVQKRVLRARQLISTGMSLAHAAAASGFADQSHMTRCFVHSFGFSPGVYVRQAAAA